MTTEQLPSETKLSVLRKLAEGQMSFTVSNDELLALVECAEAAKRVRITNRVVPGCSCGDCEAKNQMYLALDKLERS